MENNCIWIGIGGELDAKLTNTCINLNKQIASNYPNTYVFSSINRPHLNLYDLDIPARHLVKVSTEIIKTVAETKTFTVEIERVGFFDFGMIFLEVTKTPALTTLHTKLVETVSQYKESCMCSGYTHSPVQYTQNKKLMLSKYGNPFVLNEYNPHVSVGFIRASKKEIRSYVDKLNAAFTKQNWILTEVSLVEGKEKGYPVVSKSRLC